jgi:hypothetical protein
MKVAVFSEADRDELAVRILIEGVLGKTTSPVKFPLGARGWDGLKNNLPTVIKSLHYNKPDAEGLIIVADSDNTPLHKREHEKANQADPACRFCILQLIAEQTRSALSAVQHRKPLNIAVGLAIPTIEAWLLCGVDSRGSEAAWHQSNAASYGSSYRKVLKKALYGSEISPQQKRNQIAREAATRLAKDINQLETHFPIGFGLLAEAIRNW